MPESSPPGSVEAAPGVGVAASASLEECDHWINHARTKADRNKRRARLVTLTVTSASAAIPVVLATVPDGLWQKGSASVLAAIVLVVTSISQLEHPHERWVLFRRFQRLFEAERTRYVFGLVPYDRPDSRDEELAERVLGLGLDLHRTWESVVPSTQEVTSPAPHPPTV